ATPRALPLRSYRLVLKRLEHNGRHLPMNSINAIAASTDSEKAWLKILSAYRQPHVGRSAFELAATLIPFILLWAGASVSVHFGYWFGLILALPAAGFLLRLFMLQH